MVELFDFFHQYLKDKKDFPEDAVVYELIWDRPFDNLRFNHSKSQLLQLVYGFLAYEEQEKEPFLKELMVTKALRRHEVNPVFRTYRKRLETKLSTHPLRNADYYKTLYLLQSEWGKQIRKSGRTGDMGMEGIVQSFSVYTVTGVLRLACALLSLRAVKKDETPLGLLSPVLEMLGQGAFADVASVQVYYRSYLALTRGDATDDFVRLRTLLAENAHLFPQEEMRDLYLLTINFCIKKLNKGVREFIRVAFDLYRSGLDTGILLENGILSPFTYNNILLLGLNLKEFQSTEQFLFRYRDYLPKKTGENYFRYNLAIFYFRKPDYDKAMDLLQKIRLKEVLYNLDARRMLLRIYYEKQEWDALDSLLDSFRTYVYRQENIGYHRTNYLNLIKIVKKMRTADIKDQTIRHELAQEIESLEALAEREWLVQRLK